jgi:hypothetical protein
MSTSLNIPGFRVRVPISCVPALTGNERESPGISISGVAAACAPGVIRHNDPFHYSRVLSL